jgi:hypothetical protein
VQVRRFLELSQLLPIRQTKEPQRTISKIAFFHLLVSA